MKNKTTYELLLIRHKLMQAKKDKIINSSELKILNKVKKELKNRYPS